MYKDTTKVWDITRCRQMIAEENDGSSDLPWHYRAYWDINGVHGVSYVRWRLQITRQPALHWPAGERDREP